MDCKVDLCKWPHHSTGIKLAGHLDARPAGQGTAQHIDNPMDVVQWQLIGDDIGSLPLPGLWH